MAHLVTQLTVRVHHFGSLEAWSSALAVVPEGVVAPKIFEDRLGTNKRTFELNWWGLDSNTSQVMGFWC